MPIKHYIDHGNGKIEEVDKAEFDTNLRKAQEKRGLTLPPAPKAETRKTADK